MAVLFLSETTPASGFDRPTYFGNLRLPLLFIGITPIIATLRDCTSTAITNN